MSLRTLSCMIAIAAWGVAGCRKASTARSEQQGPGQAPATVLPTKVGSGDTTVRPTSFDLDEKTGRPRVNLVLRLDYFPDPKPGVTNLPVCLAAFPADFELGTAMCDGKAEIQAPVYARNVDQDCYTDPTFERIPAAAALTLPGCARGAIAMHTFTPRLRVDIELKDVK